MDVRKKTASEKRMIEYSFVAAQIEKLRMDSWRDKVQSEAYRKVDDILTNAPTVDAVEVVRCKDCKHRFKDSWCEYVDDDDNFYCARGERKEGTN